MYACNAVGGAFLFAALISVANYGLLISTMWKLHCI